MPCRGCGQKVETLVPYLCVDRCSSTVLESLKMSVETVANNAVAKGTVSKDLFIRVFGEKSTNPQTYYYLLSLINKTHIVSVATKGQS